MTRTQFIINGYNRDHDGHLTQSYTYNLISRIRYPAGA